MEQPPYMFGTVCYECDKDIDNDDPDRKYVKHTCSICYKYLCDACSDNLMCNCNEVCNECSKNRCRFCRDILCIEECRSGYTFFCPHCSPSHFCTFFYTFYN